MSLKFGTDSSIGFYTSTGTAIAIADSTNFGIQKPLLLSSISPDDVPPATTGSSYVFINSGGGISIKDEAGQVLSQGTQGTGAVAIGLNAGLSGQKPYAIAVGSSAGQTSQGTKAIAIGFNAGSMSQGNYSIAIGNLAGQTSQASGSIILNAGQTVLNGSSPGFYVNPVRSVLLNLFAPTLTWDNNEIVANTAKLFVIQHPEDADKYLVHACLEGPEAGVYYRGSSRLDKSEETIIQLPSFADKLAYDFTIHLTPIYEEHKESCRNLLSERVKDGKFKVHGKPGPFDWIVYGKRGEVEAEIFKNQSIVKGDGPYKYITNSNQRRSGPTDYDYNYDKV